MTIFEAIASTTEQKPFIQSPRQKVLDIKLKPIDGVNKCEVYFDGELINENYQVKSFELKERWATVV